MDQKLQAMIEELQGVCGKPAHEEVQKIQRCLPVPNDHVILWADMISYGGYPAGIALTDRAFISKAPKKQKRRKPLRRPISLMLSTASSHGISSIPRITTSWSARIKEIEDMRSKAKTRPSLYSRAKLCTKRSESTAPMR